MRYNRSFVILFALCAMLFHFESSESTGIPTIAPITFKALPAPTD